MGAKYICKNIDKLLTYIYYTYLSCLQGVVELSPSPSWSKVPVLPLSNKNQELGTVRSTTTTLILLLCFADLIMVEKE
jgi:hypothetical protein